VTLLKELCRGAKRTTKAIGYERSAVARTQEESAVPEEQSEFMGTLRKLLNHMADDLEENGVPMGSAEQTHMEEMKH
jgi:hypothetical protein